MTEKTRLTQANSALQQKDRLALARSGWTPEEIATALSDEEAEQLVACEQVIENGIKIWYQVGEALMHVRDGRLYRSTHKTFESYCQDRWQMERAHAYRLISGSQVVNDLSPLGDILPTRETHVRPLAPLSSEDRDAVWNRVTSSGDKITEARVQAEVELRKAPVFLREAVDSGLVGIRQVPAIAAALKDAHTDVIAVVERWNIIDVGTIALLIHLHSKGRETFDEVTSSGAIQITDETDAVLITAPSVLLYKAVEKKAQAHKQIAADIKRQTLVTRAEDTLSADDLCGILTGDAAQLFDSVADNSVDLFLTDPPYHLKSQETYGLLAALAARKLKPGGLCLAYSGHMFLPAVMALMADHLSYWWMFAVNHNGSSLAIWNRSIQTRWRPVIAYAKPLADGSLPLALEHVIDIVEGGGRKKEWHAWGQDASELTYWIERLTTPDMLICDPFVGGGAVPVAARLTRRRWIGTEIDTQQAQIARLRVMETVAQP